MTAQPTGAGPPASVAYQWRLTALLSLSFGFVLFDRNALSFLMPFVQPELGFNNTQVGLLSGGLSLTWAIAAFGIGVVADRFGSRKKWLVASTVFFALCSFGSGLAGSFAMLLATRLLMGVAEGGVMPLSQSLIAAQVDPRRRGIAMGISQGFGSSLMGSFVAPVVLVGFATAYGWRHAFFLAGAPGLLAALLMIWMIREARPVEMPAVAARAATGTLGSVLIDGNVIRCLVMSIAFVAYLVVTWTFMPLYLVNVRHYDPATMSWVMGVLGIAAALYSFVIPGLSDRIGRRPVMRAVPMLALILPLGALFYSGPAWALAAIFFVGWSFTGIMPLFMSTVPAESVGGAHIGAALGLCMGGSEILGGVLAPLASGYAADHLGLKAPLWGLLAFAVTGCVAALGLRETAPQLMFSAHGGLNCDA
ncbi:MAG TPA: MFS transporter [Steroidobacteraceae bacterium]|jgi:ACS family hexuronate transporter-like MFS transporter|nr:MFS transporter [Steroidobacteraceae bacterium]